MKTSRTMFAFLILAACVSLPIEFETKVIEYDLMSREYEELASSMVALREAGKADGNDWREFAGIQERVGTLSQDLDRLFGYWNETGQKPGAFDEAWEDLQDEMQSLRSLVRRLGGA